MRGFFDEAPVLVSDPANALVASLRAAGHAGIHNFSVGVLDTYFKLLRLPAGCVVWENNILSISGLPGGRRKIFIYGEGPHDLGMLAALQAECALYSQYKLDLPKRSPFKEVCYDLAAVFDPASYPSAKKRYQRLAYPAKHLTRLGIEVRPLLTGDLPEIERLHREWVAFKLADPSTMRMLFPKARYLECARLAIADPATFACFGAFRGDELISARALYLDGASAFDLAFFTATWLGLSNMVESLSVMHMRALMAQGISHINCGAGLHKNLHAYKAHWPCYDKVSFIYSRS